MPLVAPVIPQARARVREETPVPAQDQRGRRFAPQTRVRRRHTTGTPVALGRHVVRDEGDGGIVTRARLLGPGEGERDA